MVSYVLYEGPSRIDEGPIVALAASVDQPSKNTKTGPMVQVSILRADVPPWDALRASLDESICGNCVHRPRGPHGTQRSCFVDLRFITPVWFARRAPWEPRRTANRAIRVGTYGDPWAVPLDVWRGLVAGAAMWTAYTEFWREAQADSPWWRHLFMASVQNRRDAEEARKLGWRRYRTLAPNEHQILPDEIRCPHYGSSGVQCIDCNLCDGVRLTSRKNFPDRRRSIVADVHGSGRGWFPRSPEARRRLPMADQ